MDETMKTQKTAGLYTFWRALRKAIPIGILMLLVLGGALGFFAQVHVIETRDLMREALTNPDMAQFKDYDKQIAFSFIPGGNDSVILMLNIAVVLVSIFLGIYLFRFIADKKRVNVYYSLGISRRSMFLQQFAAGALVLLAAISLSILAPAFLNWRFHGASAALWQMTAWLVGSYGAMAVTAFGVSAAVFCTVGTVAEGAAFSAILLAAPTAFFALFEKLMNHLVFGSPYVINFMPATLFYDDLSAGLTETLSDFNPVWFNMREFSARCELMREDITKAFEWSTPSLRTVWIWAAAALGIAALGTLLFSRRRAELSGFTGKSTVGNFVVSALLGLSVFGACLVYLPVDSVLLCALAGLVGYALCYTVVELAVHRSFRIFAKGLRKLPPHLALAVAILLIFQGGLFGYSDRVPKLENVESAAMSRVAVDPFSPIYNTGYPELRTFTSWPPDTAELAPLRTLYFSAGMSLFPPVKDPDAIRSILALHQKIADTGETPAAEVFRAGHSGKDGVVSYFTIEYKLKNGKTFTRQFSTLPIELLEEAALLQGRLACLPLANAAISPGEQKLFRENGYWTREQLRENTTFCLAPGTHITQLQVLTLTVAQRDALWTALRADFAAMTAEQLLFPQAMQGLLMLENAQVTAEDMAFTFNNTDEQGRQFSVFDAVSSERTPIVLSADTPKTLSYLRENYAAAFSESADAYQSVRVSPAAFAALRPRENRYTYGGIVNTLHFVGAWQKELPRSNSFEYYGNWSSLPLLKMPKDSMEITDPAQIEALQNAARFSCYTSRPGYYAAFRDKDGGDTILFIPAQDMPQNIQARFAQK